MGNQRLGNIYVKLLALGQQDSDNPVFSQGFGAERRNNRAVLSSGNGDDGIASGTVKVKPVPDQAITSSFTFFASNSFLYSMASPPVICYYIRFPEERKAGQRQNMQASSKNSGALSKNLLPGLRPEGFYYIIDNNFT